MTTPGTLTILPAFRAWRKPGTGAGGGGERIVLTQKFVSGVLAYQKRWGGPVKVLVEESPAADNNLDHVAVAPGELPFELKLVRYDGPEAAEELADSAVALLALYCRQLPLAGVCGRLGVPAVYVAENTLRTRLQILGAQGLNPVIRARRAVWEWQEERRNVRTLWQAAGVQCNGTPAYKAYRGVSPDAMLYFDTRVPEDMLPDEAAVRARYARDDGVLRLAFSGRLVAIKGVDDLVRVAGLLRDRGVRFEMNICGGGEMEPEMKREVAAQGLGEVVRFRGVLDFETALVPFMTREVDLFVCCHRQGDPSCTYLETMACGVPIAGYANEAFSGLHEVCGAGWRVPMNQPGALAGAIAAVAGRREELVGQAVRSLAFARKHTFESTFAARVEHLRRIAEEAGAREMVAAGGGNDE